MLKVYTLGSPAKMACVPFPWWTSRSMIAARAARPSCCSARTATATSLKTQNPSPWSGEGVVRAAGEIHRHAVLERGARRRDRAADGAVRALDERRRPGESDPPHRRRVERAGVEGIHVLRGVRAEQLLARGARRVAELLRRDEPEREHALAEERVLLDREAMPRGQRDAVGRGAPRAERHRAARPGLSPGGGPAWR